MDYKKLQESSDLTSLISDINVNQREELYEITYAYKETGTGVINTSLFQKIGELSDFQSKESLLDSYIKTESKIVESISRIDKFIESNNALDVVSLGSLDYYKTLLTYTKLGLPFELKKTGAIDDGDLDVLMNGKRSQEEQLKKLEDVDRKLFGEKVMNTPDEVGFVKNSINKERDFVFKKGLLNEIEMNRYDGYIAKLNELNGSLIAIESNTDSNSDSVNKLLEQVEGDMDREDYIEVFKLFLDATNIKKEVVVNNDLGSVFDSKESLQIPGNDSYAIKSKKWLLKMMIHEIETHFFNEANHDEKYEIRGGFNLPAEEGHAQGLELLFAGKSFEEIGYTASLPSILMGEILDGNDFLDYLQLRAKGKELKANPERLYYRRKRGYGDEIPGVQHKDTSYSRGIRMNKDEIANGRDYKDFYLGKLDNSDLDEAKQKEKELGLERRIPKLLSEVILKKLVQGKNSVSDDDFKEYISVKYPFLKDSDIKDAGVVSFVTKRSLVKILQLLSK